MLATYGIDTLDPRLTLRRMWVLLRRLPAGSWPDPDEAASWSIESHLLAAVVDRLGELAWLTAAVNSKKQPKKPKPIPRPGGTPKQQVRDEGLGSLMAAMKEVKR